MGILHLGSVYTSHLGHLLEKKVICSDRRTAAGCLGGMGQDHGILHAFCPHEQGCFRCLISKTTSVRSLELCLWVMLLALGKMVHGVTHSVHFPEGCGGWDCTELYMSELWSKTAQGCTPPC
jgi:hypothetical protein